MSRYIAKIVIPKSSLQCHQHPSGRGVPGIAKNIKTEMNEVLENPLLKQEDKMKVYNQSLDRLLTYDQQLSKPRLSTIVPPRPPPPQEQESQMDALAAEGEEEDISSSLPPTLKTKGSALLRKLKTSLEWNNRGEVLSAHGKPIPGTNITNLVHIAVRVHRKSKHWPKGWTYFLQRMEEANIPQILLGSGPKFKVEQDTDEEGDDDDDVCDEEKIKDEWSGQWDRL